MREPEFDRGRGRIWTQGGARQAVHLRTLLQLPLAMACEGFDGGGGEPHAPAALVGLGLAEREPVSGSGELLAHTQQPAPGIDVRPAQSQQLPLPEPRGQGQDVESLQPVAAGGFEEGLHLLVGRSGGTSTASVTLRGTRPPCDGLLERPVEGGVDELHRPW